MSVGFPSGVNDITITTSGSTAKPSNTVTGDLLCAAVICRNAGGITPPAGWTTLISSFGGANGDGIFQYLPVTDASSLPASWTWTGSSARFDAILFRVTGTDLTSPPVAGTVVTAGSDGPGAIPMVLPGVTANGGAAAMVFTFWIDTAPLSDFVPGFTQLATSVTLNTGPGRSALGVYSAVTSGATGNITTANDWTGAFGQDGALVSFQQAATPPPPPAVLYQMRRMP